MDQGLELFDSLAKRCHKQHRLAVRCGWVEIAIDNQVFRIERKFLFRLQSKNIWKRLRSCLGNTKFFQDKPILENQVPKRLPLGPKVEMPVRCDRLSVAYRRYLKALDVQFGVRRRAKDTVATSGSLVGGGVAVAD